MATRRADSSSSAAGGDATTGVTTSRPEWKRQAGPVEFVTHDDRTHPHRLRPRRRGPHHGLGAVARPPRAATGLAVTAEHVVHPGAPWGKEFVPQRTPSPRRRTPDEATAFWRPPFTGTEHPPIAWLGHRLPSRRATTPRGGIQ